MWLNGGYLAAKETISLSKETKDNKDNPISSGTTFAVVLKLTGAGEDHTSEDAWTAVTGNPLDGYKLCSKHGIAGAVEAAQSADTSVFAVNTKGDYEVTVRSLPGDIEKYAAMMEDKSNADYTVAAYHTTASSLAEATTENTSMVEYQSINRQFSTVIHLTNVQNRLFVQKVDDLGEPVNGATFELYKADDVTGNSPSTYAIKPNATPYDTVQAKGMTYSYEIKGAACFPLDSNNHAPLTKGTYYLRESLSPDGYEINSTITKVIVDDSGVYVDAGEKNDGVRSMSGPGSLIASLAQFGSPDSIDNTLTHIKGKLQCAMTRRLRAPRPFCVMSRTRASATASWRRSLPIRASTVWPSTKRTTHHISMMPPRLVPTWAHSSSTISLPRRRLCSTPIVAWHACK